MGRIWVDGEGSEQGNPSQGRRWPGTMDSNDARLHKIKVFFAQRLPPGVAMIGQLGGTGVNLAWSWRAAGGQS